MRGWEGRQARAQKDHWRACASEDLVDQAISTYLVKGYRMSKDPDRRVYIYKGQGPVWDNSHARNSVPVDQLNQIVRSSRTFR